MKRKSLDQVIESLQISKLRESYWLVIPTSLLVLMAEIVVTVNFVNGAVSLTSALLYHWGIVALCGLVTSLLHTVSFDARLMLAITLLTAFTGIFGALAGVAMGFFYLIYRRLSSPFSALLEQLFPDEQVDHAVKPLATRIRRGLENVDVDTTAIPFMDIMTFGALTQRLRAVSLMLRYFQPKLGPVLQLGLKDSNNSVRVLAATSLLALDKRFYDDYLYLENEVKNNPRSRLAWLALAKHTEEYAQSHILSPERATKMWKMAQKAYTSVAELTTADMDDTPTQIALARVALQLDELVTARQTLEALQQRGVRDAAAIRLLQEVLFRQGDFVALRHLSEETEHLPMTGQDFDKEVVNHLAALWNASGAAVIGEPAHA